MTPDQRVHWQAVTAELEAMHCLWSADTALIASLAISLDGLVKANEEIAMTGEYVHRQKGRTRNPAAIERRQAMASVRQLSYELGLSPRARANWPPSMRNLGDDDTASDFFAGETGRSPARLLT